MDNFQQWRAAMLDKVGAYWDAAFREGRNGSGCEADVANSILHGDGGIEALMQARQAALAELQLYRALCEGYTLEELQRMSLTFKAQIDVLRARPTWPACPLPCGWEKLHQLALEDQEAVMAAFEEGATVPRDAAVRATTALTAVCRAMLAAAQERDND